MNDNIFKPNEFYYVKGSPILMTFDTEDNNVSMIQCNFYDGEKHRSFFLKDYIDLESMQYDILMYLYSISQKRKIIIGAVNLEYDIINMTFPKFFHPDLFDIMLSSHRWISARLKNSNIVFFDVLNHVRASVKEMGKTIGLEKLEFAPESEKYCQRDCEIPYIVMKNLLEFYRENGGHFTFTMPSAALKVFQNRFMKRSFRCIESDEREFFNKSYYGGRVEIFEYGDVPGPIHTNDVKSMYPFCMLSVLPDYDLTEPFNKRIFDSIRNYQYIVEADVSNNLEIPILPHRDKNGKLIFPAGRFSGVWSSVEFEYALNHGYKINDIFGGVYFRESYPFLKPFVEYFYPLKEQAERDNQPLMRTFYKTLLNSLYGKFASGNSIQELRIENGELGFFEKEIDYPVYSNVVWSSFITALSRVKLHEYISTVDHPVYCDTDSVFYRGRKIDGGQSLGSFAFEKTFASGRFYLPKLYELIENDGKKKIRCKGVPLDFRSDFMSNFYVEFVAPVRYLESTRRGIRPNQWITKKKSIRAEYDKRIINSDGSTNPIVLKGVKK